MAVSANLAVKVAIVTNIPAPYRIPVYRKLAETFGHNRFLGIFCAQKESNRDWVIGPLDFPHVFLKTASIGVQGRTIHCNLDVWQTLRRFNPDTIITNGFNPTHLLAFTYAMLYRKQHIPMTDGTLASERKLTWLHCLVRRVVYRRSRAFIGASLGSLALYRSYGIAPERLFQTYLCADNAAFTLPQPSERPFDLMFSGRFSQEKNPLFALDVAAGIAKTLRRKVTMLMLGSGPLLEAAKKYADSLSSEITVAFPGFVQQAELPELYRSAKLFLFPSSWDPWGVVANEACAAGQAVIVSPHAGVANELVCEGENGYVLELDRALWIEYAARLISNEALLGKFSGNSLLKVQPYNYDNATQGIIDAVLASEQTRQLRVNSW